ncbi:MAG: hypothetical protein HOO86_15645 [Bacteroidales bacterium]|nr:hypothetical protein [Bacteroidales bacterium]
MESKLDLIELAKYHHYLRKCTNRDRQKSLFRKVFKHFSDYVLKFSNLTIARLNHVRKLEDCDILVVITSVVDYSQTESLWTALENKGYKISIVIDKSKNLMKSAFLSKVSSKIPACLVPFASFASLLIKRHNPKLICVFAHFDVLPSFLRNFSNAKTIYIPHAIMDSSYLYSSIDYDYYFVFGESSLVNLKENKNKFGKTKLVKTGSPVIRESYKLQRTTPNHNLLFFSTWSIGKDKNLTANFHLLLDFIAKHQDFKLFIKPHPKEDTTYIENAVEKIINIQILDKKVDMVTALGTASIVITNYSTASIEATLLNRPVVVVNMFDLDETSTDFRISDKYLYLENYFPSRAKTIDEIEDRIFQVLENYDYYLDQCKEFSKFHLETFTDSVEKIANIIEEIYHNNEQFTFEEI